MEEKKAKGTFKEKMFAKIPSIYAWLTVGGLSAITLVVQLILIFKA